MARKKGSTVTKPPKNAIVEPAPEGLDTKHVRVASTRDVQDPELKAALAKIEELQREKEMLTRKVAKTEQERDALEAAQSEGMMFHASTQEHPTGKFVTLKVLKNYKVVSYTDNGRPIISPRFKDEKVPTFMLKIDMPPSGDVGLKIDGDLFCHGAVYELDLYKLRTVKDIVARTWDHHRSIHPGDENFYKRQDPGWAARNAKAVARGIL